MVIPFSSTQDVVIRCRLYFTDKKVFEFLLDIKAKQSEHQTVVGRWPAELVKMELDYDGVLFHHPIEPTADGMHLKEINVYGGRDQWSQLLRNKAMESVRGGSVPEDQEPQDD